MINRCNQICGFSPDITGAKDIVNKDYELDLCKNEERARIINIKNYDSDRLKVKQERLIADSKIDNIDDLVEEVRWLLSSKLDVSLDNFESIIVEDDTTGDGIKVIIKSGADYE